MGATRTPEVEEAILKGLMSGMTLVKICEADDMPNRNTVCEWMAKDPEWATKCARARAFQAELSDDKLIDIVAKVESGELTPDQARVMSSILQWRAAKLLPKKYGDRLNVEQNGAVEVRVSYGLPSVPALTEGVIEAEIIENGDSDGL